MRVVGGRIGEVRMRIFDFDGGEEGAMATLLCGRRAGPK